MMGEWIIGTVVRGFIMRYERRQEWEEVLVAIPFGEVACDADAIPHYVEKSDGKFYEYYGWEACSETHKIYLPLEFVAE